MIASVTQAQEKSISELKEIIRSFLANRKIRTRVVPLSIPTGWGKTRIAIQSIIRSRFSTPPNVIIWPQNQAHISDHVWLDKVSWCRKAIADCRDCEAQDILPLRPVSGRRKMFQPESYHSHRVHFKGNFFSVNNHFKNLTGLLQKKGGPIIFVIDEWHTKDLLRKFIESNEDAETYLRKKLLGTEKKRWRKLLVFLISGTPVGNTRNMDAMPDENASLDRYEQELTNDLEQFKKLVSLGNQERKYSLYDIYPQLINDQEKRLNAFQRKEAFPVQKTPKSDIWAKNYIREMRKLFGEKAGLSSKHSIYLLEALSLSGISQQNKRARYKSTRGFFKKGYKRQTETLKLQTLKEILDTYRFRNDKPHLERKFVIFCHHDGILENVYLYLQKQNISVGLFDQIESFRDKEEKPRVLLLMDKHSQGVSIHQSDAWIIHFELVWNPIRILQRFGRVWRIDHDTKKLTCPIAFHIPHTFSAEEEMLNRLERRWEVLQKFSGKQEAHFVNLAPLSFRVALGIRCSPGISI